MTQATGELVRTHRFTVGLSREEVAAQAHVPVGTLAAYEEGTGNITAAALERIAYVLAVDANALRKGRIEPSPLASLFFRQGAFADYRYDENKSKIMGVFERALALLEVNAILRRPPSLRKRFVPEDSTADAARAGYRLANLVRGALGNEADPLPDMAALLEDQFEILVRMEPLLGSRIDALSLKANKTAAAAIILNATSARRSNPLTARVDLAHELGHVLFDTANGEVNLVIDAEEGSLQHAEQRANTFAAELLMPAEGLRRLLGRPMYEMSMPQALALVERVRREFVTPAEITVNHLFWREYIAEWIREPLIEEARRTAAPVLPTPVVPSQDVLDRRVREALDRDLISAGKARELLQLSPWDDLPMGA